MSLFSPSHLFSSYFYSRRYFLPVYFPPHILALFFPSAYPSLSTHFYMLLSSSYCRQSVLGNIWPLQLSDSIFTGKCFMHGKMQMVIALLSPTESLIIQLATGRFDVLTIESVTWYTKTLTIWVLFSVEALGCFY